MLGFLVQYDWWCGFGFVVSFIVGIAALAIIKFQDKLIYVPSFGTQLVRSMQGNPAGYRSPLDRGMPYKDVHITSGGEVLHGWLIFAAGAEEKNGSFVNRRPTVVFFHENAGNIGIRLGFFEAYIKQEEVNVLAIAYRGYSHSQGYPSEKNLQADGLAILDWVFTAQDFFDRENVVLHGRSLGAAVMLHAIARSPHRARVRRVIVESTFTNISDMTDVMFPKLRPFGVIKNLLLFNHWDNTEAVAQMPKDGVRALFVLGTRDELTPPNMVETLFQLCPAEHKSILRVKDGEHNETWTVDQQKYFAAIHGVIFSV